MKHKLSGPDRRKHKRTTYDSTRREVTLHHGPQSTGKGVGQDLSIGGMHLLCTEPLVQDQNLKLTFQLPWDLGHVECDGRVQWVKKEDPSYSVGIQFLKPKTEHLHSIQRYITEAEASHKKSFLVEFLSFFKRQ